MYGGRDLGVDQFRIRRKSYSFGAFIPGREVLGAY
jgi:hypothetical protein